MCKIDFQDGCHLRFLIGMILAVFSLQVIPILPIKFQVNWPFGSGEVSDRNDFRCSYLQIPTILSQMAGHFRRRNSKENFKMVAVAAVLDFQ